MNEYYGSDRPVMGRCEDSSQRKRDSGGAPVTAQELRNWLVSKVAGLTGVDPQEIGVGKPFTAFGVTSREAVATITSACRLTPVSCELVRPITSGVVSPSGCPISSHRYHD